MVRGVRETRKKRSRGGGGVASGALSASRVADDCGNGHPDGCSGVRRSTIGARGAVGAGEGVEVGPHSCHPPGRHRPCHPYSTDRRRWVARGESDCPSRMHGRPLLVTGDGRGRPESSTELLGVTRGTQPVRVEVKAEYLSGHGADCPKRHRR